MQRLPPSASWTTARHRDRVTMPCRLSLAIEGPAGRRSAIAVSSIVFAHVELTPGHVSVRAELFEDERRGTFTHRRFQVDEGDKAPFAILVRVGKALRDHPSARFLNKAELFR